MDERRPGSLPPEAAIMAEYFATMRQFLESQERVMTAFIGEPALARGVRLQRMPSLAVARFSEQGPLQVAGAAGAVPAVAEPVAAMPRTAAAAVPQAPASSASAFEHTRL